MFVHQKPLLVALLAVLSIPSLALRNEAISFASYSAKPLLEVFQVFPHPLSPTERRGSTVCSYTLMEHIFSNSAGNPYVGMSLLLGYFRDSYILGAYKPLCGNDWDIAVLNLSVVSYGRQFDRLGV